MTYQKIIARILFTFIYKKLLTIWYLVYCQGNRNDASDLLIDWVGECFIDWFVTFLTSSFKSDTNSTHNRILLCFGQTFPYYFHQLINAHVECIFSRFYTIDDPYFVSKPGFKEKWFWNILS